MSTTFFDENAEDGVTMVDATLAPPIPTASVVETTPSTASLFNEEESRTLEILANKVISLSTFNNLLRLIGVAAFIDSLIASYLAMLLSIAGTHIGTICGSLFVFFAGLIVSFNASSLPFLKLRVPLMLICSALSLICSVVSHMQYNTLEACATVSSANAHEADLSPASFVYSGHSQYFSQAATCLLETSTLSSQSGNCFCVASTPALDDCFQLPALNSDCSAIVNDAPHIVPINVILSSVCFFFSVAATCYLWYLQGMSEKARVPAASAVLSCSTSVPIADSAMMVVSEDSVSTVDDDSEYRSELDDCVLTLMEVGALPLDI